ncbi:MAG: arginine--tRNA ligase [Planctomycetota bacterium]
MNPFVTALADALARTSSLPPATILDWLEVPADPTRGELALPCFRLAATIKRSPAAAALDLQSRLVLPAGVIGATADGPYLNFRLDRAALARSVLLEIEAQGDRYGASELGRGETIVVDYSSPNIAKPFGIHHLRSTVIGGALVRILRCLGYHTVGINHLGDWGTNFGELIQAFREVGEASKVAEFGTAYLNQLRVDFVARTKAEPQLKELSRRRFKELEDGEPEARRLWEQFRELSLKEFRRIYDRLGIQFDAYTGESFYEDKMTPVIQALESRGLLKTSADAQVVDLTEEKLGVAIIKKGDEATLYLTRDLAAALYRHQTYHFSKALYVVGAPQALHFQQMKAVLKRLGHEFADAIVHLPFGIMSLDGEKFASRFGNIILLEDVLDRAVEKALAVVEENSPDIASKREIAELVGIGAVIFNDLKSRRTKDIKFEWDRVLNPRGDTGPYLQYTHARSASIMRKADAPIDRDPESLARLIEPEETAVISALMEYPRQILRAAAEYEPSLIATYLLGVAACFNRFYHEHQVLKAEDPQLRNARLRLCAATALVLRLGLGLLGVHAPEAM